MPDTQNAPQTPLSGDDLEVFQRLEEAREQYAEYLEITEAATVIFPAEAPLSPPATDVPLSLTIWPDQ